MSGRATLHIAALSGGLFIGLVIATQYVAHAYGYDSRLGFALSSSPGMPLYLPLAFLVWAVTIYKNGPNVIDNGGLILVFCTVFPLIITVLLTRRKRQVDEFGKDAWGTLADAKKAELVNTPPAGVIVGKWTDNRTILSFNGPEHQLVAGATRSGKGAGHVVPTLLTWSGSVLAYDIKPELYDITGQFRSKFSHAFFLNYSQKDSACFNPLFEIRRGTQEIGDIQNIAKLLADPSGLREDPNFWDLSGASLLYAAILHQLYTAPDEEKNLACVRRRLMDLNRLIEDMATTLHRLKPDRGQPDGLARDEQGNTIPEVHPELSLKAIQFLAADEKMKSSIGFTALSYLDVFADSLVEEKSARSDFMIGDLMCSDSPVSLYLQTPPSEEERLRPLTRVVLSQFARNLMTARDYDAQGRLKKHKLLFLIDEFPSLGKLGFFEKNLKYMAGFGIKCHLIVQSFKDLVSAYGRDNTILDNCHVTVGFATADNDAARTISGMVGTAVEHRRSTSRGTSNGRLLGGGTRSETTNEQQREVLTAGAVRQLPYDEQLIFVTGAKPLRTKKIRYWTDKPFKSRATDIKAGGLGPNQAAHLDVPTPGGAVSPWAGVRSHGKKPPPIPVENGAQSQPSGDVSSPIYQDYAKGEAQRRAAEEGHHTTDELPADLANLFVGDPVD